MPRNYRVSFLAELEFRLSQVDRDLTSLSADEQFDLLTSRAVNVVKGELLRKRLHESKQTGVPLRVKYGIDPTSSDAHLGHAVPVILARRLQQMGHLVIILVGNFTALVGDPTGRVKTRPVLAAEEIGANAKSYKEQIGKVIDMSRVEIAYNAPFFDDMSIRQLLGFYRINKISPILQRDDFRQRMEGLTIAEALYPTLMAIDSVILKADIELGGNDQLLNFHTAVAFMESVDMVPQSALTTELLQGTSGDGRKMSKSEGNYISLTEPAEDAFGKVMSIPDQLMEHYFKLLTDITDTEWAHLDRHMQSGTLNPMDVKKLLARLIVTFLRSRESALREQALFEKRFSRRELPEEIPLLTVPRGTVETVADLAVFGRMASSRSEVRRLVQAGGVRAFVGEEKINFEEPLAPVPKTSGWVFNIGKRKFAQVRWSDSETKTEEETSPAEDGLIKQEDAAREHFLSVVKAIPLVEFLSTKDSIHPSLFSEGHTGGSLYYGTGLCTAKAMSTGVPFDMIGMICVAETVRRELRLARIIQLIADTHARSNKFTTDAEVDDMRDRMKSTMLRVADRLGLKDSFLLVSASEFDESEQYLSIYRGIQGDDHEYVRREWADIEYLWRQYNLAIKLSWTVSARKSKQGFDERLYDDRFAEKMRRPMSFLYINAGRTLNKDRPKASPYISVAGERRILLKRGEDVAGKLRAGEQEFGNSEMNGARQHLSDICTLFEAMFGSGDRGRDLSDRINRIIERVC